MNKLPADNHFKLDDSFGTVGTAVSHFQIQPNGHKSDWGHQLFQAQQGKDSRFHDVDISQAPDFERDEEAILSAAAALNPDTCDRPTTFRLSIDISEVCPEGGVFNEQAMAKYIRTLARCHRLNLEPMVTLNHWTLPKTFARFDSDNNIKNGPLEHPEIVDHFAFFIEKVADFLCDPAKIKASLKDEGYDQNFLNQICDERLICRWFISLNEPFNMIFTPYMFGVFPPYQKRQFRKYPGFIQKLRDMHRISHEKLHDKALNAKIPQKEREKVKVGMSHTINDIAIHVPVFEDYVNWGLMERMEEDSNSEFLGLQYYCRIRLVDVLAEIGLTKRDNPRNYCDHPDFGTIDPEGMYRVLSKASRKFPDQEFIVSEFGAADKEDQRRPYWILETVRHIIKAKQEGVKVNGAILWSLINNWEWMRGMTTPFGLYDHRGQKLSTDHDDEQNPSSRLVWQHVENHLLDPKAASQQKLIDLKISARRQFEKFCEEKK